MQRVPLYQIQAKCVKRHSETVSLPFSAFENRLYRPRSIVGSAPTQHMQHTVEWFNFPHSVSPHSVVGKLLLAIVTNQSGSPRFTCQYQSRSPSVLFIATGSGSFVRPELYYGYASYLVDKYIETSLLCKSEISVIPGYTHQVELRTGSLITWM